MFLINSIPNIIYLKYPLLLIDNATLEEIMEKLENMTKRIEELEACCSAHNASIQENTRRHENVDISFNKLCPLIDEIFDVASPPGSTRYDCCYESYTGTTSQIGGAMLCVSEAFLGISPNPPFPQTGTGTCASTCGNLPPNVVAGEVMPGGK